jgi:hypothetical protein
MLAAGLRAMPLQWHVRVSQDVRLRADVQLILVPMCLSDATARTRNAPEQQASCKESVGIVS